MAKKELNEFSIFSHTRLNAQSYMITESYGYNKNIPNSYMHLGLVIGKEKVAVIDTGIAGTSGLRDYIEQVILGGDTSRPVIDLQTHNHVDHIAGAMMFDERYMHEADINEPDLFWNTHEDRRLLSDDSDLCAFANYDKDMIAYCREHYYRVKPTVNDFIPIHDGDIIDLGGVSIQVTHMPGHSPGSCCFYDMQNHVVFCGDSFSGGGTVEERYAIYKKCAERWAPDSILIDGHGIGMDRMNRLYNLMEGCEEVLNGENLENDREAPPRGPGFFKFTKERIGLVETRVRFDPNKKQMIHTYKDAMIRYEVDKE